MTTLQDIESWVHGGESEVVEFKRSTGERREGTRTICAMLNHRGGRVVFGIEPNGRIIGQMVSDRTIEEVAQEIGEIEPPVFPAIERLDLPNGMRLWLSRLNPAAHSLTPTEGMPTGVSGTQVGNFPERNTIEFFWSDFIVNSVGKTNRRQVGLSPIWIPERFCARLKKPSGEAGLMTLEIGTPRKFCVAWDY